MAGRLSLNIIFIVQGEGRGHMTQAIALQEILKKQGHILKAVLVGRSEKRVIPNFFYKEITSPIHTFESPNFVFDPANKSIKIFKSLIYNLTKLPTFLRNINTIHHHVVNYKPDIIINFYDLLAGLYVTFKNPGIPYLVIGHQYFLDHPVFIFPQGKKFDQYLMKLSNRITSLKAQKKLALSFRKYSDSEKTKIKIVPPLIRKEVIRLIPSNEKFILVYMVNSGYGEDVMRWHKKNPTVVLHCFWDKKEAPEEYKVNENLTFHKIDDVKFLRYMASCSAYVSTAGFESICEAMFLGKPVMMVPAHGHYEQKCNAIDAVNSKAGISSEEFDISKLINYIPIHPSDNSEFKDWVINGDDYFQKELEFLIPKRTQAIAM
ncbi:MAG: glycosyltransferase family protein [Cytophagaceae bacterium]